MTQTRETPVSVPLSPTREAWLTSAVEALRPMFLAVGYPIPAAIYVSVGWPSRKGTAQASARIGECWDGAASADGRCHIFISPILGDGLRVLDVLVHELGHVVVGCKAGHKGPFKAFMRSVGLTGKATATIAGPELTVTLSGILDALNPYPHAALTPGEGRKKQTTRMLKLACPACGYTIRTTRQWIDKGLPTCCCGEAFAAPDGGDLSDDDSVDDDV